jgi:hypothetical protein
VRYFSLALFAGIRPGGELEKLAGSPECIHLDNGVIRLSPAMVKNGRKQQRGRPIGIQPNLHEWLTAYPGDILPINCDREVKAIRKKFGLTRDVLRHTFISNHVKAFGSFSDTSLESGNSERRITIITPSVRPMQRLSGRSSHRMQRTKLSIFQKPECATFSGILSLKRSALFLKIPLDLCSAVLSQFRIGIDSY